MVISKLKLKIFLCKEPINVKIMKCLKLCTLFLLTLSLNSFAQVPTSGLLAYYPFNGNAQDASGNAYNGIVNGATLTTDRFGNANSAYAFGGTNQYITSPFAGISGSKSRTVSVWFKVNQVNTSEFQWTMVHYGGNGSPGGAFSCNTWPNQYVSIDVSYSYIAYNKIYTLNDWHHYAVSYSDTTGTNVNSCKVYLDGKLLTSILTPFNTSTTINTGTVSSLMMGKAVAGTDQPQFQGSLDDIRIYNRALKSNDILALYNEGKCFQSIAVTDTLKISFITGLNEIPEDFGVLKVYPNPSHSSIILEKTLANASYSIKITNSLSQVVYTSVLNQPKSQIQLNTLGSNGIYYLTILDNANKVMETKKLILE